MSAAPEGRKLTGKHVLAMLLAFFGVMLAVNGVFIYQAVTTFTGVVTEEPYVKGLKYNQRIAVEDEQKELGWSGRAMLTAEGDRLIVELKNRGGEPLGAMQISGVLGWPTVNSHDIQLTLAETAPGRYEMALPRLEPGNWVVDLQATASTPGGQSQVFRLKQRVGPGT